MDAPDPLDLIVSQLADDKANDAAPPQQLLTPKELHGYWAAIYDVLRPTGEVDSRAKLVLTSSLGLIALCVSVQKPNSISLAGMLFKADKWIVLAIAVALVVVYSAVQLYLAWYIQNEKILETIAAPLDDIGLWMDSLALASRSRLDNLMKMAERDKQRRAVAWNWYKQRDDEIRNKRRNVPIDDVDYFAKMQALDDDRNEAQAERDRRILTPEGQAYRKELDAITEDTIDGKVPEYLKQATNVGHTLKKVEKIKTTRLSIDLWFPLILAASSFAIFVMTMLKALIS